MFLGCGYILLWTNFRPQTTRMQAGERVTEEKRKLWLNWRERRRIWKRLQGESKWIERKQDAGSKFKAGGWSAV